MNGDLGGRRSEPWWRDQLASLHPEGLTGAEVEAVALGHPGELPSAYVAFLRVAGRACRPLWVGSDVFYPGVLDLRAAAQDLLEEAGAAFALGEDDTVFLMHQGYLFLFLAGPGPDPQVHLYVEAETGPKRIAESFSDYVIRCRDETQQR